MENNFPHEYRLDMKLQAIVARVDELTMWARKRMPSHAHQITMPNLAWMSAPTAREMTRYAPESQTIELNGLAIEGDLSAFICTYLPYEMAHHLAWVIWGEREHGPQFKALCAALQVSWNPKKSMVTGLGTHRRVPARCACGASTSVTYTVARRIAQGVRTYPCRTCEGPITLPEALAKRIG